MTLLLEAPSTRTKPRMVAVPLKRVRSDARVPGLDVGRFIACIGVIWLHFGPPPYDRLGHFRMPFFTLLLAYFAAAPLLRGESRSFHRFIRIRALRILVPFVFWMLIVRLPNLVTGNYPESVSVDMVLLGLGSNHLWFLPFAFCASLAAYLMMCPLLGLPRERLQLAGWILLGGGLLATVIPISAYLATQHFWQPWLPLTGPLLLGLALPLLIPTLSLSKRSWPRTLAFATACAFLAAASMFVPTALTNLLGTLSGLALFLAGFSAPLDTPSPVWKCLGQLSYGMYLSHGLFSRVFARTGLTAENQAPLRFLIALLGSAAITMVLLRLPWGRFLVGLPANKARRNAPPRSVGLYSTASPALE